MKKTCKECGKEFELKPGKLGLATVCPRCSEPTAEQRKRLVAADEQKHKLHAASVWSSVKQRVHERKRKIMRERLGFVAVPGKKFTVRVPK
jgi:uncharacterized Zn finger protein (UPF0148 family)